MREIFLSAGLSTVYMNHCLHVTATTVLSEAGVESRNIMSVTGHCNEGSIKSYVSQLSLDQHDQMCEILHSYSKECRIPHICAKMCVNDDVQWL